MAAGATYEPIATTTLGSAGSFTFSAISSAYTDLVVVIEGFTANGSAAYISTRFNGDTTTNYSTTRLLGDGSSTSSDRYSSDDRCKSGTVWGSRGVNIFHIMNYTNTTTFKTMLNRDNNAANRVGATISLWRKTPEAITSIEFNAPDGGGFASSTTATIYGIKAA